MPERGPKGDMNSGRICYNTRSPRAIVRTAQTPSASYPAVLCFMTIEKAIKEYLEWKSSYAPCAAKSYGGCLKKFSLFTVDLEELEQEHVTRFITLYARTLKPRTIVWYVNILKDFFGYYAGRCHVTAKLIRRPKFTPEIPNFLTEDEFEQMDEYLDEHVYKDLKKKVMIRLLWRTGIRVSELCDLTLDDIHNAKNHCRIITKKNKKHRWIFWSDEDHRLLMRYIGVRICLTDQEALFTAESYRWKGKLSTMGVARMLKKLAVESGLERHVHPHMFRHGKAHFMLKKRANLEEVKDILGHVSIVSTQMYTKLLPDEMKELAERYV